jgi:hypothetical protein
MSQFRHLWAWPIALGVATALGLTLALLGDGWWDQLSAVALGAPVAVGLWYGLAKRGKPGR